MQDIPVFTTDYGVASLVLKEIPYCASAYIQIHDFSDLDGFLRECCDFCVMAGAKTVYASGDDLADRYPLFTEVWKMECPCAQLPPTDATLMSLQNETLDYWRGLYNARMRDVPTASYMSYARAKEILKKGSGYFVCREDTLLGLGVVSGNVLECIISLTPGAGTDVLLALCSLTCGASVSLEVASENKRAIALYHKLGFSVSERLNCWYKIHP